MTMSDDLISTIISEFREEFHIPPFYDDSRFEIFVQDANSYFTELVPDADFETDYTARKLMRQYMFYQHENRLKDFYNDYNSEVLHWLLAESDTHDTSTEESE